MSTIRLSSVVLDDSEQYRSRREMYVRTAAALSFDEDGAALMPAHFTFSFETYFGMLSYKKWREYTNVGGMHLNLSVEGKGHLTMYGFGFDPEYRVEIRHEIGRFDVDGDSEFDVPDGDWVTVGFQLDTMTDCVLHEAYWTGDIDDGDLRDVELSICTTTYKKEPYITKNIRKYESIIESDSQLADHLVVHIVDNGNTLSDEKYAGFFKNPKIRLHPNRNGGGAAGFARGMMETLEQTDVKATHALMMDDDISLCTEALERTYSLLRCLKDEWGDAFLSGAMLSNQMIDEFVEDVGHMRPADGSMGAIKPHAFMCNLNDVIGNDNYECIQPRQYAAFWYCCVPVGVIERQGLTMPFFVRGDDAEYGMRDKERKIMSMNGICVWHDGFDSAKFRPTLECYLSVRNCLIISAITESCHDIDIVERKLNAQYLTEIRKYSYPECEMMLDALEDYMAGPMWLATADGPQVLAREGSKLPKPKDMPVPAPVDLDGVDDLGDHRNVFEQALMNTTRNGNRIVPDNMMSDAPVAMLDRWCAYPGRKILMHKRLWMVSPDHTKYVEKVLDRAKYDELERRRLALEKRYADSRDEIDQKWRDAASYLTSPDYWKWYLGLSDDRPVFAAGEDGKPTIMAKSKATRLS